MDNLTYKKGSYYSNHACPKDMHLNMLGLFIVMIMQANNAWKIENTIIPIILFVIAFILKVTFIRRPRYNPYFIKRGVGMLLIAICFFSKGLNEREDYLRIHHGMWHCFVGISSFFLWQSIDKDCPEPGVLKCEPQKRYEFFSVLKAILCFNFFKDVSSKSMKFNKSIIHNN
jgi:hypothetical protein